MFSGFNKTVIGGSHTDSGKICQDYSEYYVCENYSAAVVADGHGSRKHFRSDIGSQLAVKVTLSTLSEFLSDMDEFEKSFRDDPSRVIKKIQKHIISYWNKAIAGHFIGVPITDKEKEPFTDEQFRAIKHESMYGTTLIACVMCKNFSFGIQIGDGSLVTVNNYAVAQMPIADDESCPANLTASMCNTNAIDLFNHFYTFDELMAVFVSTDGLFTSFGSREDFQDYHTILVGLLDDRDAFLNAVSKNLVKRTNHGTRDDISLAGVYSQNLIAANQEAIMSQIELNRKMTEIRKAEHKAKIEKQKAKAAMMRNRSDSAPEPTQKYEMESI